MAKKVTPELARIRGIPPGIDLRSPTRHPDILGGDDLLIMVEEMREATGYRLPVSVKLGAGRVSDDVKIAVKDGFDFIELDGMQGSTGASSAEAIDYVGVPTLPAVIEAITATNPFSSICGRVCDAPCEPACRRVDSDGAVQIRNLKRFVMDKLGATYRPPAAPVTWSQSVGIVGAGPAGLVAAHDLCVAGYSVHVYEMTDRLGGMMIWGIPAFRLPPGIIEEDVERPMQRCPGLTVHLDTALGYDLLGAAPRGHLLDGPHGPARCIEAQGDAGPATAPAREPVSRRAPGVPRQQ